MDAAGRKGGASARQPHVSVPHHLPGSLATDVLQELQGGIIWSRRERLGLALLLKLKEIAALYKAAKNLCYNTLLCY